MEAAEVGPPPEGLPLPPPPCAWQSVTLLLLLLPLCAWLVASWLQYAWLKTVASGAILECVLLGEAIRKWRRPWLRETLLLTRQRRVDRRTALLDSGPREDARIEFMAAMPSRGARERTPAIGQGARQDIRCGAQA